MSVDPKNEGETDYACKISFNELIDTYSTKQASVLAQLKSLATSDSSATPGKFLLIQFGMSQITQIGESISNMISMVNSLIAATLRNQKGS